MPPYEPNRPSRSSDMNPVKTSTLRGGSLPLITLGAGMLLGLILGLIIGWAVAPVKWTNAWPGDLSDEARAQYLAAVAEAYVYYGDEQAAEIARNRLYSLNDNLAQEIADAQTFFAENPQRNDRIYISNLGKLAQGLGVSSPDIRLDTPPAAESAPGDQAQTTADTQADTQADTDTRSWVNWLLWTVAALALIIGGLFVISRLSSRRVIGTATDFVDEEPEGFDDEDEFGTRPGRNPFQRPTLSPMPTSVREADRTRSRTTSEYDTPHAEEYGFDEEHDESPSAYATGAPVSPREAEEEELYDEELLDMDDEELDTLEAAPGGSLALAPTDYEEQDQATYGRSATRSVQDATIKTYTVHYQAGIPDYDQAYTILDPVSGRYIGECGMGVHLKNGALQNNPDSVIALDIWLVDKMQEKSYSSQSRVLLSEYVANNKLETAFTRERPNDAPPLVPRPGMTFQLEGPSLMLDCEVVEASCIKNGPTSGVFQSVKLDMTVRVLE